MRHELKFIAAVLFILTFTLRQSAAQVVGSAGPIYPIWTQTASSSLIAKPQAGWFYGVSGTPTVAGFFMIFDSATVPADGTVAPIYCYSAAANNTFATGFLNNIYMTKGIVIAFSTGADCFTLTKSASAHMSAQGL